MRKIRLAYLTSRYPAISHTFILREVFQLRKLGFDIFVASINRPDRDNNDLTIQEQMEVLRTYYVKNAGIRRILQSHLTTLFSHPIRYLRGLFYGIGLGKWDIKKAAYGFFYFVEAIIIGHWMRQQQLTHLHVHFATEVATVGLLVKHIFPVTLSMTVHGPDEFYNVSHYLLKQKIEQSDFICCISHFARSQLIALSSHEHWHKLEVSRLGVDPHHFMPRPFRENPQQFEILCVGRLVPVKGQHILIAAVMQLLQRGRHIRLCLVGDGPDRENLEQLVKQHNIEKYIVFAGAVNQERILSYYHKADIFVLASFAEGLPVVLMEAMMMEIPCISTYITGIPELITTNKGILVTPGDVASLAQAITHLMDDTKLRQELGQQGRLQVIEHYDLSRNVQHLSEIFRRYLT